MDWFTVDKEGLAKLMARKGGKAFVFFELLQNAWDTDATRVDIHTEVIKGRPLVRVTVKDDDPEGFANLTHAYTLFAESAKKDDPEKRGRFNLGEKLVLSLCEEAEIRTTKGMVRFDKDGRSSSNQAASRLEKGSVFTALVRMTRAEYDEAVRALGTAIQPHDKDTYFNDEPFATRKQVVSFPLPLKTEIADSEGQLRPTIRSALVALHEVRENEVPTLYEMGIPIVELTGGEPWHINIHQKVPLNVDRDNVTPAYLRDLRTAVLNHTHQYLADSDSASQTWVREAMADAKVDKAAVQKVIKERFGEKVVSADPSDPEGTKIAAHEGFTVVPGGALSKAEWENVRRDKAILPAGKVTPSRPQATAEHFEKLETLTLGMKSFELFAKALAAVLLGKEVELGVSFVKTDATFLAKFQADARKPVLQMNVEHLKEAWFENGVNEEQLDLMLHEFGHFYSGDHLSKAYNDALSSLGARLAFCVLNSPLLLTGYSWGLTWSKRP